MRAGCQIICKMSRLFYNKIVPSPARHYLTLLREQTRPLTMNNNALSQPPQVIEQEKELKAC